MLELTETQQDELLSALAAGSDLTTSAHYADIDAEALVEFLELAENPRKSKARDAAQDLMREIKKAKAGSILEVQGILRQHASEDWRAAAYWLERQLPEIYGK